MTYPRLETVFMAEESLAPTSRPPGFSIVSIILGWS